MYRWVLFAYGYYFCRQWGLSDDAHRTPAGAGGSKTDNGTALEIFSTNQYSVFVFWLHSQMGNIAYVFGLRLHPFTRNGSRALSLELRRRRSVSFVKKSPHDWRQRKRFPGGDRSIYHSTYRITAKHRVCSNVRVNKPRSARSAQRGFARNFSPVGQRSSFCLNRYIFLFVR